MVVNYQIDSTPLATIIANLNVFASNPATSKGEGETIYNSGDNTVYVNTGTTGTPVWSEMADGIWSDSGTLVTLNTVREVDFQGERIYINKEATDAASTYIDIGAASGNLIIHIGTGKAVEWTVG